MRVLVVEDDIDIGEAVRRGLEETGILAEWSSDADEALIAIGHGHFDVIVLDVMLGRGMDGLRLCRLLRERDVPSAILMLTARDAVPDRVRGLEAGADDYLVKPFDVGELKARLRALLRRVGVEIEEVVAPAQHPGRRRALPLARERGRRVVRRFACLDVDERVPGVVDLAEIDVRLVRGDVDPVDHHASLRAAACLARRSVRIPRSPGCSGGPGGVYSR